MSLVELQPTDDLPDHTQLPCKDDSGPKNWPERPQSMLLADSLMPVINQLHPDGHYVIGSDSGIYWRYVPEEPLRGCKAPDWFYIPGPAPLPPGTCRRSYVLWKEHISPQLILEYVYGDGLEEHDAAPESGKFWVYEQAIRSAYYGIFELESPSLEMYKLVEGRYQQMKPNKHGRYFIPALGVELGVWHGLYANMTLNWLRWWDGKGNMLLTGWGR